MSSGSGSDSDLERQLRAMLRKRAGDIEQVPTGLTSLVDAARVPAVGFPAVGHPAVGRARGAHRWLLVAASVAAVLAVVGASIGIGHLVAGRDVSVAGTTRPTPTAPSTAVVPSTAPSTTAPSTAPSTAAPSTAAPGTAVPSKAAAPGTHAAAKPTPVHVSLFEGDGQTYGVGMPIIAQFDKNVTSAHAFDKAVTVTVNGQPAKGAWFWEKSNNSRYAMEAHYRPQTYWPAHSTIEMTMPLQGLSAGPGLAFDDSLTLSMNIGAAHISHVDGATETMVVQSDGQVVKTMPVSLGKATTPTYLGAKVVMEKDNPELMIGTADDPYRLEVPWSVRVTDSGEFVHAAAWNSGNIGSRSTSNGCTNLNVADAKWFYNFSIIGDVVTYSNTGTSKTMPSWDGFGDWNVPWSEWVRGNLLTNN